MSIITTEVDREPIRRCRSDKHWDNLLIFRKCWLCGLGELDPEDYDTPDERDSSLKSE